METNSKKPKVCCMEVCSTNMLEESTVKRLRMTEQEKSIIEGLNILAPEAAAFFKSGVDIFNDNIEMRAYLLAHIAREIESGIRDILCPKELTKKCEKCGNNLVNTSHQKTILKSLGLSTTSTFAKKWYEIAKDFHKYAHRHGVWKAPREQHAFDSLWKEFINILDILVGNFYSITDRIDTMIQNDTPSREMLLSLKNILSYEPNKIYFFRNLIQTGWLDPLYKANYFSGDKNPEPVSDLETTIPKMPDWVELDFLKNIAWKISKTPNSDFSVLLKIIKDICEYRNSNNKKINNLNTDESVILLISFLPANLITKVHYRYIKQMFKTKYGEILSDTFEKQLIVRFIKEEDKTNLLECLKIVLSYKRKHMPFDRYSSQFDTYFLYNLFKEHVGEIIKISGINGLKIALKKIDDIEDLSFYNIKTIEDHYQNGQDFYKYLNQLIVFIRESLLKEPLSKGLEAIITKLLNTESHIHSRIAFYVINIRYNELQDIFWDISFNPLSRLHNYHELYELFKSHCLDFSEEQVKIILNWIKELPDTFIYDDQSYPSPNKKMWLMSLLDIKNENVKDEYLKASKNYPHEIEHPGFSGWMTSYFGNCSPLPYEIVKNMEIKEIISYFIEFQKSNSNLHDISMPNIDGLSDVIEHDVIDNINKYTVNINPIIEAPIYLQYKWVMGLWKYCYDKKRLFNSLDAFLVIEKILYKKEFWEQFDDESNWNINEWFVKRVLSLINEGLNWDKRMFEEEAFAVIKSIILLIKERGNKVQEIDFKDIQNTFLNSIKGDLYQVIIDFIVASAIKSGKPKNSRWDNDMKVIIENLLYQEDVDPLFYYALGKELNSLYWIDSDWLYKNFNKITSSDNQDNWRGFIIGYHYHNNVTQLFETLNTNNQYQQIFNKRNMFDDVLLKKVITHICVAYHSDCIKFEINDSLMQSLLKNKVVDDYENIVQYYWAHSKHKELAEKVRALWRTLYEINKNEENIVSKYFLGESYKWLGYFECIDDELKQWLLSSAHNLMQNSHPYFIKSLIKYTNTNPQEVGEIVLEIIITESKFGYLHDLETIVSSLYVNDLVTIADKICKTCAEKNYLGLREIYRLHHKY